MFRIHQAWLPLAAAIGISGAPGALAQPSTAPPPSSRTDTDPSNAAAPIPSAIYRSPLGHYRAFVEPEVAPWRQTNDRVLQRGGWRAYAREASEPDTPAHKAQGGKP